MGSAIISYGIASGVLLPLKNAEDAAIENLQLKASSTYPAGTLVGEMSASAGIYAAYASGNTDGSQLPTHILMYSCVTDASGNVFMGSAASSEWGQSTTYCPAYRNGYFSCADLVGLDTNAISKLGRLTEGVASAGRFQMFGE